MKNAVAALLVGLIFALGLGLSGMTQPHKVIAFLDLSGNWDPSLIFVMMGAIGVHFLTYKLIRRRTSPLFSADWHVPTKKEITPALAVGSILFGMGWGLAGFCPGPAITSLASFDTAPALFVASMFLGMMMFRLIDKKWQVNR